MITYCDQSKRQEACGYELGDVSGVETQAACCNGGLHEQCQRPDQAKADAPKTPSQALGVFCGGDAIDPPAPAQNIAQAAPEPAQAEATSEAAPVDEGDSFTRVREDDYAANTWDFETGQFIGLPNTAKLKK